VYNVSPYWTLTQNWNIQTTTLTLTFDTAVPDLDATGAIEVTPTGTITATTPAHSADNKTWTLTLSNIPAETGPAGVPIQVTVTKSGWVFRPLSRTITVYGNYVARKLTNTGVKYFETLQLAVDESTENPILVLRSIELNATTAPINITSGQAVTIYSAPEYGAIISRSSGYSGKLFTVELGGELIFNDSLIVDGAGTSTAAIVTVNGGTFTMRGGIIRNNTPSGAAGGGVSVNSGTFTMHGGTISGNTPGAAGGGVSVNGGTFTMHGGTISGNKATGTGNGGGVYVSSTFTMHGGTISGNKATGTGYGGGVYVAGGAFIMSGGTISGNEAVSGNGGGVYVAPGTFIKTAGTIYGNESSVFPATLKNTAGGGGNPGHAVYVSGTPVKYRDTTADLGDSLNSTDALTTPPWNM
jgi:hypothetical protein